MNPLRVVPPRHEHKTVELPQALTVGCLSSEVVTQTMRRQDRQLADAAKFFWIGTFLLLVVFLTPDAGRMEHRSFFAVARSSPWSQLFDWPAAWCSVKIILLSLSVFFVLDAFLSLMIRTEHQIACGLLFIMAIVPVLLGVFGFYELAKAVL